MSDQVYTIEPEVRTQIQVMVEALHGMLRDYENYYIPPERIDADVEGVESLTMYGHAFEEYHTLLDWLVARALELGHLEAIIEDLLACTEGNEAFIRKSLTKHGYDYDQIKQEGRDFIEQLRSDAESSMPGDLARDEHGAGSGDVGRETPGTDSGK